ncbi:hypothetical protein RUM44_009352 [Polyplax serrata]|uniref:Uncharacterized protein n=1 Tax=Polyplax serrata TaxID=468196 RepID=A0ABR1ASF9_POLSC
MECRENSTLVTLEESEKQVVIRCYHLGTLSMGGEEGSDEDDDNIQAAVTVCIGQVPGPGQLSLERESRQGCGLGRKLSDWKDRFTKKKEALGRKTKTEITVGEEDLQRDYTQTIYREPDSQLNVRKGANCAAARSYDNPPMLIPYMAPRVSMRSPASSRQMILPLY